MERSKVTTSTTPINVAVIDTFDLMFETVRWFKQAVDEKD